MADIYATINEQPNEIQERVVEAMRLRAEEPEMQAMLERYLTQIDIPQGARVLEIGCGVGAATIRNYVHDPWFMRRLPKLVEGCGFSVRTYDGHGYVKITDPRYLTTVVGRGADVIVNQGTIGPELAAALKFELNRRIDSGQFYCTIMFGNLVAQKPM